MIDRYFDAFNERQNIMIGRAIDESTLDQGMETIKGQRIDKVRQEMVYADSLRAETRYVELAAEQSARMIPWEDAGSMFEAFFRNKRSERIWGTTIRQEMDPRTGDIVDAYSMRGRNYYNYQKLTGDEFIKENWEKLGKKDAEMLWQDTLEALPTAYTETIHMIKS